MIKNLLLIFFVFLFYQAQSQVTMEKVLVEMGTATWSSGCANEVQIIDQMKANGLEICVLNYHLNDPFANQYANQRASFYGIQSLPYPVVGGQNITPGSYENYLSAYNLSFNTPSFFTISADGYFADDTLKTQISVNKVAAFDDDNIFLHLAVVESDIYYNWQGLNVLHEVERAMSPNGNGTMLDFSQSNNLWLQENFIFSETWNPQNMMLLAFLQNNDTKEILQCHTIAITEFSPLPVHAFFQVADTLVCRKDLVDFQNLSTGDVESVQWFFEGGTPEQSSDFQPLIKYNAEGAFSVKLIVINSVSSDTNFIDDYIHVQPLPVITFGALPGFCIYDPAYELTEGQPMGGNYFGLFVDTGYFHPQVSGPGNFPVYFAWQNAETGCSDTLIQPAIVDLCDGLENAESQAEKFPYIVLNQGDNYILKLKSTANETIKSLKVFDLSGRVLYEESAPNPQTEIEIFIPHSSNRIVIFQVVSETQIHSLKYLNN